MKKTEKYFSKIKAIKQNKFLMKYNIKTLTDHNNIKCKTDVNKCMILFYN